jgi:predicted RNA-binding protein with PUA-like domain
MAFWLLKTEPEEYSWERFEQEGKTMWTGVRNFQARNNLRAMKAGDIALIYHSGQERNIVGVGTIHSEAVPDTTADKGDWVAIEVHALKPLTRVVSLEEIRNTHGLSVMPLATHPRLSVQPVTDAQAAMILKIAKTEV